MALGALETLGIPVQVDFRKVLAVSQLQPKATELNSPLVGDMQAHYC